MGWEQGDELGRVHPAATEALGISDFQLILVYRGSNTGTLLKSPNYSQGVGLCQIYLTIVTM